MPIRNDYVVKAFTIRKGDIIDRQGVEYSADTIKSGPKWTEVRTDEGQLVWRSPNETDVLISRIEPTEEERETQRHEMRNQSIYDFVKDHDEDWAHAQSKFAKEIEGGYDVSRYGFVYSALIHAQAEHAIKSDIIARQNGLQRKLNEDEGDAARQVDWVEAFDSWRDWAMENVLDSIRGDSRSTSQIHNILDDVQIEMTLKIARRGRLNPLDF